MFSGLLPALFTSFMLVGCSDDDNDEILDLEEQIRGMWVNTQVDDEPVVTNEAFMTDYRIDFSQRYAIGLDIDDANSSWFENTEYTYSVENGMVIVEGPDVFGDEFYMEFEIHEIDDQHMRYSVPIFMINGEPHPDPHTYTLERVTDDHLDDLPGTWQAQASGANGGEAEYYFDYFMDGSYSLYFRDDEDNWLMHADEDNQYYLYGGLLVMNFNGGPLAANNEQGFEAWRIELNGDNMTWSALREDGETHSVELERVAEPPM